MKKIITSAFFLLAVLFATAQKAPYRVIFDVTSPDTLVHKMVVHWIEEITTNAPEAEIEVVFYGKSLDMITKDKSVVADKVMKYASQKNVAFRVCRIALKNNNVDMSQLLDGVGTVPDGIYEIISKQHEGWGYIKASR